MGRNKCYERGVVTAKPSPDVCRNRPSASPRTIAKPHSVPPSLLFYCRLLGIAVYALYLKLSSDKLCSQIDSQQADRQTIADTEGNRILGWVLHVVAFQIHAVTLPQ